MAITNYAFRDTNRTLLTNPWTNDFIYGAMAVSSTYVYSVEHSSFADFSAHVIGDEVAISGKSVELVNSNLRLNFKCNPLNFVGQGLTAKGIVIFSMPENAFNANSKLAFYYEFSQEQSLEELVYHDADYGLYNWIANDLSESYQNTLLLLATIPYLTTTIKCQLVSTSYTFSALHETLTSFSGSLIGSAVNLSGKQITLSTSKVNTILKASKAEFTSLSGEFNASGLVLYIDNVEQDLLFYVQFDSVVSFDKYDSVELADGIYYLRGDSL